MRWRVKVTELMQRERLSGEVVRLFPSRTTGIIHGDDGYDVAFSDESLVVGFWYGEITVGLRVSYGIFFAAGAKVPTAINVKSVSVAQTDKREESANAASTGVGCSEVV